MIVLDDVVVYSASDLALAAQCEFSLLRRLDHKLKRVELANVDDPMLQRTAQLGDVHEAAELARHLNLLGEWSEDNRGGVRSIARPPREQYAYAAVLAAKHDETLEALRAGAGVVFQGGFFDGRFHGWSDFLVRQADGAYEVHDTKLAHHAKVTAVLQLAAYAHQLSLGAVPLAPLGRLVLGNGKSSEHRLADVVPVYLHRRRRLEEILDRHLHSDAPAGWDDGMHSSCGRCDLCAEQVAERRDVLMVAGLSTLQRARLKAAGTTTIDELADLDGSVPGIAGGTLSRLTAQARLQVKQIPGDATVSFDLFAPAVVGALPERSAGDIFFDFEGDPLWSDGDPERWGLEYLFGWVETPSAPAGRPPFRALWAHDRAEEKAALEAFVDYVVARRRRHPDMHVYHYAPYETTALKRLVGRHGTREAEVDDLLRGGVFVDLYSTVRQSLRVSQPSYSIKKLEPLYMEGRDGLDNAGDSIDEYYRACEHGAAGEESERQELLNRIESYNDDDCRSTYLLREWLAARAAEAGVSLGSLMRPSEERAVPERVEETQELVDALGALAAAASDADARAFRLLAAALGYHAREEKPFWWAHFDRLNQPPDEWADTRDVLRASTGVNGMPTATAGPWQSPTGRQRAWRREVRIEGELDAGSTIGVGAKGWLVYENPTDAMKTAENAVRGWNSASAVVTAMSRRDDGTVELVLDEPAPKDAELWDAVPMALVPCQDVNSGTLRDAIRTLAQAVVDAGGFIASPAMDVLRRRLPAGVDLGALAERAGGEVQAAIVAALRDLSDSYLAVQGPPGTGKTYTGARVVKTLVDAGWRVGVVAQSHAVVENFLEAVLEAGVDPAQVGKKTASGATHSYPWRDLKKEADWETLLSTAGCVVGGTAWDFVSAKRVPERALDLLVIDEAGQFCLANTIAVAQSTRRLLLLGDPQQLPQVSQGTHPEPVDTSALGWLVDGHATMPEGIGFFLEETRRLRPELCEPVSVLAYDGRLRSHGSATQRTVEGVEPGLHTVLVEHWGNKTVSPEEAEAVVEIARDVIGRRWRDPGAATDRPLEAADVIVVAAYNAQVARIGAALRAAGLKDVRVGTVDKFQGQEAPVAVVSLAASSADDVPRGMGFLISRNRLNVAISRGKYCAYLVHSPRLRDYLPTNVAGLEELGAFVRLGST